MKKTKVLKEEGKWTLHERFFDSHRIEAICPHGVGHHKGTHGCDGCCSNPPKDLWKKVSKTA
jgi:hypothetical protein